METIITRLINNEDNHYLQPVFDVYNTGLPTPHTTSSKYLSYFNDFLYLSKCTLFGSCFLIDDTTFPSVEVYSLKSSVKLCLLCF